MAEQRFPEPIAREADVLGTIEHLARQLVPVLDRRGEGGRLFQTALFRADGKVHRLEIGTGSPLRDPARIRKLFEERLAVLGDACDPGFGYDMVRLSALVTERCDPAQTGLAGSDHAEELAHLIDRFGARFGFRRVTRLVPQDTHIPEYAVAAVPAHAIKQMPSAPPSLVEQDSLSAVRPVRLFKRPESIEAIAQVPDGPPISFRWRHMRHQSRPCRRTGAHRHGMVARRSAATNSRAITSASRARRACGYGSTAKGFTTGRLSRPIAALVSARLVCVSAEVVALPQAKRRASNR